MARTIVFYQTADGKCPVEEFIDALSDKDRKKTYWVLRLVRELDRVPAEYFKKLVNSEDIWECRVHTTGGAYRIFSFFFTGNTVVLTHGYSKKTQQTDALEIARAERYRKDFLARRKNHG